MKCLRPGLLLAATLLAACSTGTRLAYNNLDTLARVEIGGLVSLESPQKEVFGAAFKTVWDWHRLHELPAYAVALRQLATELDRRNPDRAVVDRTANTIDLHAQRFAQQALPGAARLMASFTDEQVNALLEDQRKQIEKNLRKEVKETSTERAERLSSEFADAVEDWLGATLPAQQTLIDQRIAQAEARGVLAPEREHARALIRVKRFADVLASRAQPGFAERLLALAAPADNEGIAEQLADRERGRSFFTTLAATLDEAQRAHLAKRLRRYAEDCEVLAAKPIESATP